MSKIPSVVEMRRPALEWAMSRRGGYRSAELKAYLANLFKLTKEQLAEVTPNGKLLKFANRVDWVTANFTKVGIHTGLEGRPHDGADDPYYLTEYGYAVGERKEPWPWPTKRRRDARAEAAAKATAKLQEANTELSDERSGRGLTIEEAKRGLAIKFNVSPAAIKITIEG
jgi:hypothetical protein